MHQGHHRNLIRAFVLALLVALVAGCSSSASDAREQAIAQVESLGSALGEAVILSYQASQGNAAPDAGTRAVAHARTLTLELSETASLLDPAAQAVAFELTELANETLVRVGQTEFERAEKMRLEEFVPVSNEFTALPLDPDAEPVAATTAPSWSTGKAIAALAGIAVVGVFIAARYRRGDIPDPVVEAKKRKAVRSGDPLEPRERAWSEIPALFTETAPEPEPSDDPDANRTTKARTIEVDLRALLMTALHQVKDYGWDMSIVCPELTIEADPVKLRHAVLAALGNAFLGGAQRVGIVVEDLEGDVLLTIGRDAPPSQQDAEDFTERFSTQVQLALGVDDLEASLINDDDVSLISVGLGRKVVANEVSQASPDPDLAVTRER